MALSHPTRVRGLKFKIPEETKGVFCVAPYTGAWIEIKLCNLLACASWGRTLHGCVDWNLREQSVLLFCSCRTLHGCVDWNWPAVTPSVREIVAPYTGAWIEIFYQILNTKKKWSHPTRVRGLKLELPSENQVARASHPTRVRGLKFKIGLPPIACLGRTLHGCVDWNLSTNG